MTLIAAEQFLLELINRARLDPVVEAARNGIDLNEGLAAGTITAGAKQVLVSNDLLERAAVLHSQFMIDADIFSHTGAGKKNSGAQQKQRYSGMQSNLGVKQNPVQSHRVVDVPDDGYQRDQQRNQTYRLCRAPAASRFVVQKQQRQSNSEECRRSCWSHATGRGSCNGTGMLIEK